jgi:antitoxin ParD1/3/4
MVRQSISFTKPNDNWLKEQIDSEEFASKSELVNNLVRKAREREKEGEWIRARLIVVEEKLVANGFVNKSSEEILAGFKEKAESKGQL